MTENEISRTTPVPLSKAIEIFFPAGGVSKSSLRHEARKGRLQILRIAGKDFVTREGIEAMLERCAIEARETAPAARDPLQITAADLAAQDLADALAGKPERKKTAEIAPFPGRK